MKIRNPYYPCADCTPGEFFVTKKTFDFVFTEDERIAFTEAFYPIPIVRREEPGKYDDIYLLIIDDEWYAFVLDYVDGEEIYKEDGRYWQSTRRLRDNEKLDSKADKDEIIYLLTELCAYNRLWQKHHIFHEISIEYKGETYPWKHWNE